jgi:phosphoenolpyruvate carboxylase
MSSFYHYARNLVNTEALILQELEKRRPIVPFQDEESNPTLKELSQYRIYVLTEIARTLGYDLVKHDPWRRNG